MNQKRPNHQRRVIRTTRRQGSGDDPYATAREALGRGDFSQVLRLLSDPQPENLGPGPDDASALGLAAAARAGLGDVVGALRAYEQALIKAPDNVGYWLRVGALHEQLGRIEGAQRAYQRALLESPSLPRMVAANQVPAAFTADAKRALSVVSAKLAGICDQALRETQARFPDAQLERLEAGLSGLARGEQRGAHDGQRPALLGFPQLRAQPWFAPEEFPWAANVAHAAAAIYEEYLAIAPRPDAFTPYLAAGGHTSEGGAAVGSLAGSPDWNAYHLYRNGTRIDAHCRQCPRTVAALEPMLPRVSNQMPEVFFSRLAPAGHIVPHHGLMNVRLTVHLGLVIPPRCGIRAHDETRVWEPNELLIFDDSFEHEAWNESDQERVVLIFEAWHPDLSQPEIDGIERVFALRRAWMEQCA